MTRYKIHVYPNQLNMTCLKEWEIASPQFAVHVFWSFSNGMVQTIWFSNLNFQFSNVNGILSTPGHFGTKGCAYSRVILAVLVLVRRVSTVINAGMYFWYFQQKDSETIQTQQLREKIDDYETQIEDYKSELDKVNKVGDTLVYIIFHSPTCSWKENKMNKNYMYLIELSLLMGLFMYNKTNYLNGR